MTEEDVQELELIIENAARLIVDATLLAKAGSFPSAFALNVLALEEIGKAIQRRWKQLNVVTSNQKRSPHLQKQWAVACLLVGNKTLPFYKRIISGQASEQASMLELAAAFIDSKERRFFERVASVELDRSKQASLYQDRVTVAAHSRAQIDAAFVLELSETIGAAMPLLKSDVALHVGGIFYELLPKFAGEILEVRHDY